MFLTKAPWKVSWSRSEAFPRHDIWFLGVILPGLCQIHRVLGKPPPPSPPSSDSSWGGCRPLRHPPLKSAYRPPGFTDWSDWVTARMAVQFNGLIEWQPGWLSNLLVWLNDSHGGCPVYWFDWMTARMAVQFTGSIEWQPGWLVLRMGWAFQNQKMKI